MPAFGNPVEPFRPAVSSLNLPVTLNPLDKVQSPAGDVVTCLQLLGDSLDAALPPITLENLEYALAQIPDRTALHARLPRPQPRRHSSLSFRHNPHFFEVAVKPSKQGFYYNRYCILPRTFYHITCS